MAVEAYNVDKKEEVRKFNKKSGEVETWYRVWATSKGDTYFHVDIPEDELSRTDEILTKRAKELDAI